MRSSTHQPGVLTLDEALRAHVLYVLEWCGWSQVRTAQVLQVDRKTVYRMLRRWGIDARALHDASRVR